MPPVLLISMPFGPLRLPSLGLGLLQAGLGERGIESEIRYFTLDFARRITPGRYLQITRHPFNPDMIGEWVFAEALQGRPLDDEAYFEQIVRGGDPAHAKSPSLAPKDPEGLIATLRAARAEVPAFMEACVASVLARKPRVLGLTSVFEQTAASLALAQRIKVLAPDILIAFGGANAEGEMGQGLFEAYPFLDVVVSGEADHAFPDAVEAWLNRDEFPRFPGFHVREGFPGPTFEVSPQSVKTMDDLPIPDYSDYFAQKGDLDLEGPVEIPFETSRGCWWGQKQHCTFCGLNGSSMAFRSKRPDRAYEELCSLVARFPGYPVQVVDNILDMGYFKSLLPKIAEKGPLLDLFWEVKANLTEVQMRVLKSAGVMRIQPGIESFSDEGLRLMGKGVSALQNILLLRRCAEFGILPAWNLLVGFPGESLHEIKRMADLIPKLHHLKPPEFVGRIRLDRFSPNYSQAETRGLVNVRPYPAYGFIHGGHLKKNLDQIAYNFTFEYSDGREVGVYSEPLEMAVEEWRNEAGKAGLMLLVQQDGILVFDSRTIASSSVQFYQGAAARVLKTAGDLTSLEKLESEIRDEFSGTSLDAVLGILEDNHLVLRNDRYVLSLPVRMETASMRQEVAS